MPRTGQNFLLPAVRDQRNNEQGDRNSQLEEKAPGMGLDGRCTKGRGSDLQYGRSCTSIGAVLNTSTDWVAN